MSYRTITTAIVFAALAITPASSDAEPSEELIAKTRLVYKNTPDIPNDVFLTSFLNLLSVRFNGDPGRYASYVSKKLQINDFEEAQEVAAFLTGVSASMSADANANMRSMVCPFDAPRPLGQEVFAALDSADDAKDAISDRYLITIETEFGEKRFSKFLAWMDSQKASTTIIRFDHAKFHKGKDPDIVRQDICGRFDSIAAE